MKTFTTEFEQLGFAANELGVHSRHAFVQALNLARRGFKVFPASGNVWTPDAKRNATDDIVALIALHKLNLQSDWRVWCGQ
jgi:hypothetical protein